MARIIVLLVVVVLMSVVVTWVTYLFSKNTRVIKYLPSFASILMASYFFLLSTAPSQGLQDIGRGIIAGIFMVWAIAGIICAVFIDGRIKNRQW